MAAVTTTTTTTDNELRLQRTKSTDDAFAETVEKPIPQVGKIDYSGAHEKTDPKEIALVKKLDRWIMV